MSKRTKWTIAGIVVLAIAGIAGSAAAKKGNKATEVRIEGVEARDLVASVTASGQVRPRTKVDLSADITGKITRLAVKDGDYVKQGQFLLQIDPQQFDAAVQRSEAALSNARARLAQAKASLIQSQRNYQRSAEIKKSAPTLISDEQLEQLKTTVEVNEALLNAAGEDVKQSEASLKDAKFQLSRTTIYAPMSGRVTRLVVEAGETAIQGTFNKDAATLMTISDMSILETKVKVDETDVSRISLGDSAVIQLDAFPDTTFVGKVVEISNSSVKGATTSASGDQAIDYEVTVRLLNPPPETRPDFSATAKIVTDVRNKVLSIPIIALTVRENEALANKDTVPGAKAPGKQVGKKDVEGVFVVAGDNKVTFRPVKVGIAGEKHFEVLSGLKAGDRIVGGTYQAIRELKDGTLVKETKPADPKAAEKKS
ncbi:MAG: efflux RND transporter periplasmic adaptor subunit [Gemmatimonadaceae bacterium]|nr:efflux RND transporter periplasmic adaptor subunit [Gemmatimonadaceae bacterium]